MIDKHPIFQDADVLTEASVKLRSSTAKISSVPMTTPIGEGSAKSFYMTCAISRSSVVMAECIDAFERVDVKGAAE